MKKGKILLASIALCCFAGTVIMSKGIDLFNSQENQSYNIKSRDVAVTAVVSKNFEKVIIDPGHGGIDGGCTGYNGTIEKDVNLAISSSLKDLCLLAGFEVIMTRETDISIHDENAKTIREKKVSDMENRKAIIKNNEDAIFLSIHQNQFTNSSYFGGQMFFSPINSDNQQLANALQNRFKEIQSDNTREIKVIDTELFLFKETRQPAVLIECGFLSNEKDEKFLSNKDGQKKVAAAILAGLIDYKNLG